MKAFFPGSFDPFTKGHYDIVQRALKLFDGLIIGIGFNENKCQEWPVEIRLKAIRSLFEEYDNVSVVSYSGLTVKAARHFGADIILRGVRSAVDYEYEKNIADVNRLVSGMETLIMLSDPSLSFISSSMVRELMHNGFDVSGYIEGNFPVINKK